MPNKLRVAILLLLPFLALAAESDPQESPSIHQLELQSGHPDFLPSGGIAPHPVTRPRRSRELTSTVVGFLPYWTSAAHWQGLPLELLSQASWFALELNASGGVANAHGWPDGPLADSLHAHGVDLLMCAALFGSSSLRSLLSSSSARQTARSTLLSRMETGDADGLMIDFEGVPSDQYATFGGFMGELRADLDALGQANGRHYSLMVCTPAVDWNGAYNYTLLSTLCDALFIMAYDYRWSGSSSTGPVSPATGWGGWNVAWSVADHLAWNGNRPQKLVLGLPWYGYDWPCQSSSAASSTTGSATARSYSAARGLASSHGLLRESVAQTPWCAWNSGGWRQCWYDDTLSLGMKLDLAQHEGLQGVGIWALGYEGSHQDLWAQLRQRLWSPVVPPPADGWNLAISLRGNEVELDWQLQVGAAAYRVYAAPGPFTPPMEGMMLGQCEAPPFRTALSTGLRCFRVTALDSVDARAGTKERRLTGWKDQGRPAGADSR